ncbi:MAG: hypothetical protein JWO58_50 [Chitinophagaceae bacterium]|nr:hypothetical protein [Chitinophagaceae bacterium]
MKKGRLAKFILIPIFAVAALSLLIFVFMSLWNWLVPDLFHGPSLDFCHAAGLLLLSKIIFGLGKGRGHCGKCGGGPGGFWKNKMRHKWEEKMAGMTLEEREQMKDKWKNCWWGDEKKQSPETKSE